MADENKVKRFRRKGGRISEEQHQGGGGEQSFHGFLLS